MSFALFADLQNRVHFWLRACFGDDCAWDRAERAARLFEESAELAQAEGVPLDRATRLIHRVYGRPPGQPGAEAAGVAVGLLGWAAAARYNVADLALGEVRRIEGLPIEHWRQRHAEKAAAGIARHATPLPLGVPCRPGDERWREGVLTRCPFTIEPEDVVYQCRKAFKHDGAHVAATGSGTISWDEIRSDTPTGSVVTQDYRLQETPARGCKRCGRRPAYHTDPGVDHAFEAPWACPSKPPCEHGRAAHVCPERAASCTRGCHGSDASDGPCLCPHKEQP